MIIVGSDVAVPHLEKVSELRVLEKLGRKDLGPEPRHLRRSVTMV